DTALEVIALRAGNQTEEHLPGFTVVVQDSGRLVDRIGRRAVRLADALPQRGIRVARRARLDPHEVVVACTGGGRGGSQVVDRKAGVRPSPDPAIAVAAIEEWNRLPPEGVATICLAPEKTIAGAP